LFNINYFLNDTVYESGVIDSQHKYEVYLRENRPKEFIEMRKIEKIRCSSAVQRLLAPKELPPLEKRKELEHMKQYQYTARAHKPGTSGNNHNDIASMSGSVSSPSLYRSIGNSRSTSRASSARPFTRGLVSANGRKLDIKEWNTNV